VFNGFNVGEGFAKTGLTGALGDFGQSAIGKGLLAGAQSFTTNVASSAINAFSWSNGGLGWSTGAFTEGAFGRGSIASTIGASAGAFTRTGLTKVLSAADNKFYSGAVSLAGSGATELGRYGTYLGYEYASGRGGNFWNTATRAYDSMGGVTLNVANAGVILDLVGTGVATGNGTGQSDLGRYAQRLSASGLVELNLGRNGVTGRLGTGGTDVGGGLYRLAKGVVDRSILENFKASDEKRGTIAMNAYVYGDWTAENTARRLGIGKDNLAFGFEGAKGAIDSTTKGYTQSNGNGGRTIFLKDGGTAPGALLNMAVSLQHEAYRNGVSDSDNGLETYRAVKAHTEMAAALLHDEKTGFLDQGLANDINAYVKGGDAFSKYVGDTYDSSGDYWKVLSNGNIVFDGKHDLYDENGNLLRRYEGTDMRWSASLADHLGTSRDAANQLMIGSEWRYDKASGTFSVDPNGTPELQTNDAFKGRYFLQINYMDKLWTSYGGSIEKAATALRNDLAIKRQGGTLTSIDQTMEALLPGIDRAAGQWNLAMNGGNNAAGNYTIGMWNQEYAQQYESQNRAAVFAKINQDFVNNKLDDTNTLFSAANSTLVPVVGDDAYISTKTVYPKDDPELIRLGLAGKLHGQSSGGLAVDIATRKLNYPIYTTQYETVLSQLSSLATHDDGGLSLYTQSALFQERYLHMQEGTVAQSTVNNVISSTMQAQLFRFTLPPGYQFGNVGNTGEYTTGTHLHWELVPNWKYQRW
jgi:hypothetical protein